MAALIVISAGGVLNGPSPSGAFPDKVRAKAAADLLILESCRVGGMVSRGLAEFSIITG